MKSELDTALSLLFRQLKHPSVFPQNGLLFAFYLVISLDNRQILSIYIHTHKSGGIRGVEVPNT